MSINITIGSISVNILCSSSPYGTNRNGVGDPVIFFLLSHHHDVHTGGFEYNVLTAIFDSYLDSATLTFSAILAIAKVRRRQPCLKCVCVIC